MNFLDSFSEKKNSDIKFNENQSSGSRAVPCGQTDIHDKSNSRFSQFCETRLEMATLQ